MEPTLVRCPEPPNVSHLKVVAFLVALTLLSAMGGVFGGFVLTILVSRIEAFGDAY